MFFPMRALMLLAFISFSAQAEVLHPEKLAKYQQLLALEQKIPGFSAEPFRRELFYEEQGVPLQERAKRETNLLAESIKKQVHVIYHNALERLSDPDLAFQEIKADIENDAELLAPELQEEITQLAFDALMKVHQGEGVTSAETELAETEKFMARNSAERSSYLNNALTALESLSERMSLAMPPAGSTDSSAEKSVYASEKQLMSALASTEPGTRWLSTGGWIDDIQVASRKEGRISFQFKVEFLGNSATIGPTLFVKLESTSNIKFVGDRSNAPLTLPSGKFDLVERDFNGNPIYEKGVPRKRWIAFVCEEILFYEIDLSTTAGFTVAAGPHIPVVGGAKVEGSGHASAAVTGRTFVNLLSRRIAVPEEIGGRPVTQAMLQNACSKWRNVQINSRQTVRQLLGTQLHRHLQFFTLRHPNMNCAEDRHCISWYRRGYLNRLGKTAVPRCLYNRAQKIKNCVVLSRAGSECPVYQAGKLVSDGKNERQCDRGLRCVKVKEASWIPYQYAVGRCVR